MARQGRQPRGQPQGSSTTKPVAPKPKGSKKGGSTKSSLSATAEASGGALDVYSFSSSKKRPRGDVDPESRAKSRASAKKGKGKARADSEEEEEELDSDSEDSEGGRRPGKDEILQFTGVKPKGLKMGMSDDEEGGFNSEDDEEIDSDESFEDEEDLPPKPTKGKAASQPRRQDIDLDEDEIDLSDEDGEGYMDLVELLDNGEYPTDEDEDGSGSDSEGDSDSSEGESEDDDELDSEMELDGEAGLEKLGAFVEGLESKKRKAAEEEDGTADKKKKRVVLKERTEAYPEGEYVAVTAQEGTDSGKLNLDDLLSSFAGSKNPRLAALRKTLKPLAAPTETTTTTSSKSHLKAAGPLAAPLPGRLQDKIEREAAYEKTKEETDKWNETVRRMKGESGLGVEGARHERLTLPLMGGAGDAARGASSAEWSAKFQPTNDLESSIQSLLTAGQMGAKDLQKAESAALAALDPADLAARQAELRQQRDLMFRAERKAKRVSKIKSKAFRRIQRRAKGKGEAGLSLDELADLDEIDGGDRVTEEKAKMEIARARERATLKHSAKGGRWAKNEGGIGGLDEERNAAVRQMVERGEQLRKKIAGIGSDDDDDGYGDEDGSEEDDADADYDQIRSTAFDELASLDAKDAAAVAAAPKLKGVLNMKFMKDAVARGEREVQGEADALRRRLELMDEAGEGNYHSDGDSSDEAVISEQIDGNLGRMVFGPSSTTAAAASSSTAPKAKVSNTLTTKLTAPLAISSASRASKTSASPLSSNTASVDDVNPWLTLGEGQSGGKVSRKMNKAATGKDERDVSRVTAKVDRHKSKLAGAREAAQDDAQVELDLQAVMIPKKAGAVPQIQKAPATVSGKSGAAKPDAGEGEVESSDEDDEAQHDAQRGKGPTAFKQRDLVAKAFAGDNVIADFQAEKRKEIERDAPREEDNTLPGWGSWSGKGVKKQKNAKKFITKIAGITEESRKDASFSNVIISEKKDKKAAKYLLKDLPFPYTSAAQHEHKLRTPLGHEWSTSTVVRDQTLPKVQIKPGVTIRPVDRKI